MLTSEFNDEMGTLIRSLSQRAQTEPYTRQGSERDALEHIERAILVLVNLHIQVRRRSHGVVDVGSELD